MYLDYYKISENPFFRNSRDKTSLWLGGNLPQIFSIIEQAIVEKTGVVFLAGDAGTGKSTVIKMITDVLENRFIIATLSNPDLTGLDFFNVLSIKLGFDKEFKSKSAFLVHLRNFLRNSHSINKNILLIISQAERLKLELFEELALLADIELNDKKMISILLVGVKGWMEEPTQKNAIKISNKTSVKCNLDPLNQADTASYIAYCLSSVGTQKKVFNEEAIQQIFSFSKGNLNLINTICDRALRKGYSYRKKKINPAIIKECKKEIQQKIQIDEDVEPRGEPVSEKTIKEKESIITGFSAGPRRWLWFKALLVILFLFSSYLLYNFQTEDTNMWKTDEIARKEYDFHKLKEKEALSFDTPQEITESSIDSVSVTQGSNSVSPDNENEGLEASPAENRQNSDETTETKHYWPFPTFKKIIYFKYDSNTLPPDSLEILDKIADFAIHNPDREFIIKGYTDSTGAYSYNLTISKFRADSAKNYLIAKGVDPAKLDTLGLGSQDPIFSNATAGGRQLNRRVEIELKLE